MISRTERLLIALIFALFAAGITLVIASAQGENPPAAQDIIFRLCQLPYGILRQSGKMEPMEKPRW